MDKLKYIFVILCMMSEFWFAGIPIAGAIAALAYIATGDNISAVVVFIWMAGIYFALEYADVTKSLKEK